MIVIGVTGKISSGKNTISNIFNKLTHAPIFDADKVVHEILSRKAIVFIIEKYFPYVVQDSKIIRKRLSSIVFSDEKKLKILEKIVHPLVEVERKIFIKESFRNKKKLIILNIPLLFKNNAYKDCDFIIVVKNSYLLRKYRYIKRLRTSENFISNKKSESNLINIEKRYNFNESKKLIDFVIYNLNMKTSIKQVKNILINCYERKNYYS